MQTVGVGRDHERRRGRAHGGKRIRWLYAVIAGKESVVMPAYQYEAAYASGEKVTGVVEALNQNDAVAQIRK